MSVTGVGICGAMIQVVLTTFTDCGGFLSFLGLATLRSSLLV